MQSFDASVHSGWTCVETSFRVVIFICCQTSPFSSFCFLTFFASALFATQGHVCNPYTGKHSQTLSSSEEKFEWRVDGMTFSDCADNGILVSLQIVPQEMAENCFWIKVKEEKFENPDLFSQLSLCFSSQSKGKNVSSLSNAILINLHTQASFSLSGNRCQFIYIYIFLLEMFFSLSLKC